MVSSMYLLDLASGTTADWVYGTQNVSLAYVFEFRDHFNGMVSMVFFSFEILRNFILVTINY